jgi:amino acid transporter
LLTNLDAGMRDAGKSRGREELIQQDVLDLHRLGYAQQLYREMGGFSNFAISFSIISVLTGAILLFGYGLKLAGPVVNSVGWPLVSLFTLTVAASMAELASAYPTAGGLYFWAHRLGGRGWGWTTAWLNMLGQVTITAGIDVAAAIYLVGALTRILGIPPDLPLPLVGALDSWSCSLVVMVLIMVPQVLINAFGIRLTARLNDLSVWWHVGGVSLLVLLLGVFGRIHHPLAFAFSAVSTVSPLDASSATFADGTSRPALTVGSLVLPSPLFTLVPGLAAFYRNAPVTFAFALGLLQAQWTYTGYDASVHVAEETVMARLNSAWGVFLSVAVSAVVGYVMLLALTLAVPDLAATTADPYPVLYIIYANLGPLPAHLLALLIGGAMWLCGLSSITSMSRMWFAFARDGGMPGHRLIRRVHPRWRTPVWAIVVTSILAVAICCYSAAYFVVTSISTITLYLAYALPVYLNWRNRRRGTGEHAGSANAPWTLGRWGAIVNLVALVWVGVITILFVLPPNELVLWTMLLVAAGLLLYWRLDARRRFAGPTPADEAELRRIEAAIQSPPASRRR